MPLYMKAGTIQGDAGQGSAHSGWIVLESCDFEVQVDVDTVGGDGKESAPKPELVPVKVQKRVCSASPRLMEWMVKKSSVDEVTIESCRDDGQCMLRFVLKDVLLKDYSMRTGDAGTLFDDLRLAYSEVRMEQISFDADNKAVQGVPNRASYREPRSE